MRGGDITQALTMLHTTVVHTGNDVRDTLGKGVERLANGRELAHQEVLAKLDGVAQGEATQKALSGVREELRTVGRSIGSLKAKVEGADPSPKADVRGEVTAALGSLGEDVKSLTVLLGDLREELVKLRAAEPGRAAQAVRPESAEGRAADPGAGDAGRAEAGAGAGCPNAGQGPADRPGERVAVSVPVPGKETASAAAPEPPAPGQGQPPSVAASASPLPAAAALPEAALIPSPRTALAEALKEAVAPLQDELARARNERQERQGQLERQGQQDRRERRDVGELARKYGELVGEVASLRQVVADFAAGAEGAAASSEGAPEPVVTPVAGGEGAALAPVDGTAHRRLLLQAARVSSAVLVCHRDVWEFVSATAGRHRHFRMPPEVVDEGAGRLSAALSGRSLIAILISLHRIRAAEDDGDGDLPLATALYLRIEQALTALASDGAPLTIVLDDRAAPDLREAAANGARHRRDPDGAEVRLTPGTGSSREPSRSPEDDGEALAG
ncbi:hypothetical protein [Streptomyces sp. NPDC014733]|uniref:hypothetical protein n=1 Tax=Streptomyces sp. NPDC014733 TaxID=3364885 RepID=UPI0036F972E7